MCYPFVFFLVNFLELLQQALTLTPTLVFQKMALSKKLTFLRKVKVLLLRLFSNKKEAINSIFLKRLIKNQLKKSLLLKNAQKLMFKTENAVRKSLCIESSQGRSYLRKVRVSR